MKRKSRIHMALYLTILILTMNVNATWWNSSFDYKKPIEITSDSSLTNYQVAINVTYDSDMNSDFSDLRFTNEEETQELDYWIEDKSDGEWAYIWIEIDSIDTNNGTQTYMYYGNSGASSKNNGNTTFNVLFDDFDDNEISDWSNGGCLGYIGWTESADVSSGMVNDGGSGASGIHKSIKSITGAFDVRFKAKSGNYLKIYLSDNWGGGNGNHHGIYLDGGNDNLYALNGTSVTSETFTTANPEELTSVWVTLRITRDSSDNLRVYINDVLKNSITGQTYDNLDVFDLALRDTTDYIDWITLDTKFVYPEPKWQIGVAQSANQAPNNPSPSITPTTVYTNADIICSATYIDVDGDTGTLNFTILVGGTSKNTCDYSVGNNMQRTCNLSSGNYTKTQAINCSITATDNNSQSTTSSIIKTVQNSAPTTPTLLNPTSGTCTTSVTINCSGSMDNDSSDTVLYDIETNRTGSWIALEDNGDGYYIWATFSYTQNNVDLRCRATDSTANSGYYNPSGTINIDNIPPAINLNTTASDYNTVLDRFWAYLEFYLDSTLDTCLLDWNGTNESMTKSGITCYKNKTSLSVGNYTFRGWANDSAGNWNHTTEYWIYINATTTATTTTIPGTGGGAGGWGSGTPNVATVVTVPTCTDGIQNQGETGIDCGGPCSPCNIPTTTTKATTTTTPQKATTTTIGKATTTTTTTRATTTTIRKTTTTISTDGGVALATTSIAILAFILFAGIVVYLIKVGGK